MCRGIAPAPTVNNGWNTVTLSKPFKNTNYILLCNRNADYDEASSSTHNYVMSRIPSTSNLTTTTFRYWNQSQSYPVRYLAIAINLSDVS